MSDFQAPRRYSVKVIEQQKGRYSALPFLYVILEKILVILGTRNFFKFPEL